MFLPTEEVALYVIELPTSRIAFGRLLWKIDRIAFEIIDSSSLRSDERDRV